MTEKERKREKERKNDNVFIEFRPSAQSQGGDKIICMFILVRERERESGWVSQGGFNKCVAWRGKAQLTDWHNVIKVLQCPCVWKVFLSHLSLHADWPIRICHWNLGYTLIQCSSAALHLSHKTQLFREGCGEMCRWGSACLKEWVFGGISCCGNGWLREFVVEGMDRSEEVSGWWSGWFRESVIEEMGRWGLHISALETL